MFHDTARHLGPIQAFLRRHLLTFFNLATARVICGPWNRKKDSFDSGLAASTDGYERARHILNDQGGTRVPLRSRARRARCRTGRTQVHDTHGDLTDAMRPETFRLSAYPHGFGTALERTGNRVRDLTYELLCLRGSVLIDGRNRP